MSRTANAASIFPATTNARFGSLHRQRASLTPPAPVRSSRQNARSSRQPFGFRLDLCRGVALRIPPLMPVPSIRFTLRATSPDRSNEFRPIQGAGLQNRMN